MIVAVVNDSPPFGYTEEGLQIDHDLARAIDERFWKILQATPSEQLELRSVTSDKRVSAVENCEVDMVLATLTHTKLREYAIDFSQTYYVDGQNVLARTEYSGTKIAKITDLLDMPVGYITGTTSIDQYRRQIYQDLKEESEQRKADEIENKLKEHFKGYATYTEAIEALGKGELAAITTDRVFLKV